MLQTSPERPPLSARERQIAAAYIGGQNYREIAEGLGIAPSTVRTHLNNIYRKLEVSSKIELLHHMDAPPAPAEGKKGWQWALLGVSVALFVTSAVFLRATSNGPPPQPMHAFALVPFTHDRSPEARDALTRDLAQSLTSRVQLSVVRPSNARFTMQGNTHADRLARTLNQRFVLYGHIASHDGGFAGWASLYDLARGEDIWRDTFLSSGPDLLGVRLELIESLAKAIDLPQTHAVQLGCRELREEDSSIADTTSQAIYEVEGQPKYCQNLEIGPR